MSSERRERENALRDSEARYRALVMASANMVWRANAQGKGFLVCPRWQELTGQNEDDANNFGWLWHFTRRIRSAARNCGNRQWRRNECTRTSFKYALAMGAIGIFMLRRCRSSRPTVLPRMDRSGGRYYPTERDCVDGSATTRRLAHVARINTIGDCRRLWRMN